MRDHPEPIGFAHDTVSSVKVGSAVEVALCLHSTFLGECELFTADHPDLSQTRIGNDRVSSLVVRRRGASPCLPARDQVSVYMHRQFEAPCVVKNFGDFVNADAIGLEGDTISSARIGGGAQLVACVDPKYLKDCELFTGDVPDFVRTRIGNDRVSSMKVQRRGFVECMPQPGQASFYMHPDMLAPCVVKNVGDYADDDAIGLPRKSISSLRVTGPVQVCACLDESFRDKCEAFTFDDPDLRDNFSGRGNDDIESLRVQARGSECKAAPPPRPQGFREVHVTNCHTDRRTVYVWTRDVTTPGAPGQWVQRGAHGSQWSGHSCPAGAPLVVTLPEGRLTEIVAVDPQALTCGGRNEPRAWCIKTFMGPLLGQKDGLIAQLQVH